MHCLRRVVICVVPSACLLLLGGCVVKASISHLPPPDPENACTIEELPLEITLSRRYEEHDYQPFPAHVFFLLGEVDGMTARAITVFGSMGAVLAAGVPGASATMGAGKVYPPPPGSNALPRYVPPPPVVEPLTLSAGHHALYFFCQGGLVPRSGGSGEVATMGARDSSAVERGDVISFTAEHRCEVELVAGVDYVVRAEMAGAEVSAGFFLTIEEKHTGAIVYSSPHVPLRADWFIGQVVN